MIGASKILTVSYGTFSCTLEGFDDPFNTMRAIAEYFRDLAAEDRYFGAEPPTPDAAMLLKIAEREVHRRVEAKIQDNGVVLRTGDAMQAPAAPQPDRPAMPPQMAARPAQQPTPMPDGVAAKLLRIRAAVANAELAEPRAEVAPAPAQPILADYSEDEHADEISTSNTLTATFALHTFPADVIDADTWAQPEIAAPQLADDIAEANAEPAFTAAEMLSEDASFDDELPTAEISLPPPADDQPADDQPANYATADDAPADGADFADAAEVAAPAQTPDLVAFVDDIAAVEDASAADPADYAISEDDLADLRALDGDAVDAAMVEPAPEPAPVSAPEPAAEAAPESSDEPVAETEVDFDYDEDYEDDYASNDGAFASDIPDQPDVDAGIDTAEATAPDTQSADIENLDPLIKEIDSVYDPETPAATGPSEKALRARARVIKVRRDDVAADAETVKSSAATEVAALLAAQAEADLRRDLRALQAQSVPPTTADGDAGPDGSTPEADARSRLDPAGEAAVSRLIEQTNEAMAVPENRRRLSAIAHLKAAVAATVADRFTKGGSGPKEAEAKRLDPYREDLARVVRPQPAVGADETPAPARPAPLVLVSAQRIDRPRPSSNDHAPTLSAVPNSPVRPRRVTSAVLAMDPTPEFEEEDEAIDPANAFADARGFADFSERLGANSLAEILEAAAAYSVCIEGRPYFSRPQLMSQIGALSADSEYTREDGLRTFGALLRDGRIQKIKRGQFALTESSRYLAEARNLAG